MNGPSNTGFTTSRGSIVPTSRYRKVSRQPTDNIPPRQWELAVSGRVEYEVSPLDNLEMGSDRSCGLWGGPHPWARSGLLLPFLSPPLGVMRDLAGSLPELLPRT